ncbi:MAG: alpha/beta fold hydrolase [Rhodocyclaceae bacterium]
MTQAHAPAPPPTDVWIEHPAGRLFGRIWTPSGADARTKHDVPIVMLHDSLGCVELWRDFPAALSAATGRRVIAYDRLGFGRSAPRHGDLPLDFIADEARSYFPAVRAQLGFERFIAFGHSVGGGMAVNCAAEFGADCKALITVAAQAFPEARTLAGIRIAKEQFKDPAQVERLGKYHGDKARWVLDAWTETWLSPAFAGWSLTPVLPRVRCPLLAVHGVDDEYGSPRHPEIIGQHSGASRVQVEIMPHTRHMPHREHPEAVIGLMHEFLSELDD